MKWLMCVFIVVLMTGCGGDDSVDSVNNANNVNNINNSNNLNNVNNLNNTNNTNNINNLNNTNNVNNTSNTNNSNNTNNTNNIQVVCGNGSVEIGEECEPLVDHEDTCVSLGYYGGDIGCDSVTCTYILDSCESHGMCGDGVIDDFYG